MNTNKKLHFITKIVASMILMLVFLPYPKLSAQVDCDPLPEDPDLVLQCNIQDVNNPSSGSPEPGTNPAQPAEFNFSGIGGVAAAYSSKSDKVLIIGNNIESNDTRLLYGIMADPQTLAQKGLRFRLDTSGGAGGPKVHYAEEAEKFLVTWIDFRACTSCIYGRFVSAEGLVQGSPFYISAAATISGVDYDPQNDRFLIGYENNGIYYRTVGLDGTVSTAYNVTRAFPYQGQMGVAVNTNQNEYWFVYATVYNSTTADTEQEDNRIFFSRFNAQTLQSIGQPAQLSQTRLGRLAVQSGNVAYSSKGGAMAMWLERGREGVAGMWGRTINDDGSLSEEYPVITPGTFTYSNGYESKYLKYNPWTDSFFVTSGDWDGNAVITEIDLSGVIFDNQTAITPGARRLNLLDTLKDWLIKTAYAQATGSFNVTGAVTPYGAVTLASRNNTTAVATSYSSVNSPGVAAAPRNAVTQTPSANDITKLPTLVNQLYVWGLAVSVLLALLMSVVGGYYYMTSAGNAEQATKGKEYITSALIGLVIIFTAYLLLREINPDLVNFNVNSLNLR